MSAAFFGKGVGASGGAVMAVGNQPFSRIQIRYIDRGRLKFSDGLCLKIRCLYSAR